MNNLDAACEQECMATLKNKYYIEICNTLTDYNGRNNTPLSNKKIQEAIRKVMEEESITEDNNIHADTFNHALSAQREIQT